MELRQLRYFISAATHLNFTKAARECYIVQTAMTQQMAALEKELGVKLFARQGRGVILTLAGETFLADAKRIVAETERSEVRMEAFKGGYTSVVRVGYHGELFKAELADILKAFRQGCPECKVMLFQLPRKQLIERLKAGELELALVPYEEGLKTGDRVGTDVLRTSRPLLVLPAGHPLAGEKSVPVSRLTDLPFLCFGTAQEELEHWAAGLGVKVKVYSRVWDHPSLEILIESGYGVGLWNEPMCRQERYPGLRFVEIEGFPYVKQVALLRELEGLPPEAEQLRTIILEYYKDGISPAK